MSWFIGLSSREWLTQHFQLDVIEYISNEFQLKLNLDLSFIKYVHNNVQSVQNHLYSQLALYLTKTFLLNIDPLWF